MSAPRKLAYNGMPGDAHSESAWIKARQWIKGETEAEAKAFLEAEIKAGRVKVIETAP